VGSVREWRVYPLLQVEEPLRPGQQSGTIKLTQRREGVPFLKSDAVGAAARVHDG
jgi:hypothetical protein